MVEPQPPPIPVRDSYDFVIIEGGSAGCVLANRLSEVPHWTILLIEAGPEEPAIGLVPSIAYNLQNHPRLIWNYTTVPNPRACDGRPCVITLGKMLGGSSSHNYMVYNRGNRRCFDRWREMGNIGWSYGEVLRCFKKSEDYRDFESAIDTVYHGVGGYLSVEAQIGNEEYFGVLRSVLENEGYKYVDYNGATQDGYTIVPRTCYYQERMRTNRAFLEPVRYTRPNLHILTDSVVTKILINPQTKIAQGVKCIVRNSTTRLIYATKEVVLSAGAIASPQLLQISGIGPSRVLSALKVPVVKILECVGNNLQDHVVSTYVLRLTRKNLHNVTITRSLIESYIEKYITSKSGPLTGNPFVLVTEHSSYSEDNIHDIGLYFRAADSGNCGTVGLNGVYLPYDTIVVQPNLQSVRSRGNIAASSRDVLQQPTMVEGILTDEADFAAFVQAYELAYRVAQSETFKELGFTLDRTPLPRCSEFEFGTHEYFECVGDGESHSLSHPEGTCKMGPPTEADAVVNHRLRMYEIKNLRVIDASIMPEVVNSSTNAAVIMIAEKGADMIKEECL